MLVRTSSNATGGGAAWPSLESAMAAPVSPMRLARRLLPPVIADRLLPRDDPAVAARRNLFRSTPRTSLAPKHVVGCEVLPDRQTLLARLPSAAEAAEIGVADGAFSADILRIARPRKLHLVDLWGDPRFAAGVDRIRTRFASEIAAGVVEVRRGLSVDVLQEFEDASLDWVYVDTDHSFETTLAELRLARRKIRPGGVLAGHDFATGNPVAPFVYGVVQACHQFCVEADFRYRYLSLDATGFFSFALVAIDAADQ
jgi:predicted O-methyltransferase YrrM